MKALKNRIFDGVLLVDKPQKISSAGLVARVKRLLKARKVGHAGALDPFAEGLMVLCLGKATKLARFFLHGQKTYEAQLRLGVETDTQDSTGNVTAKKKIENISESNIREGFKKFKGNIFQLPPVYSALKHKGAPLYKLARKGKPIQKPARKVRIYELTITNVELPFVGFKVSCSGGTYIRTLAADIGAELGCGGHLQRLKRTKSNGFRIENAVSIEKIENLAVTANEKSIDDLLIPMADALVYFPEYTAGDILANRITSGSPLEEKDILKMGPAVGPLMQSSEKEFFSEVYFKVVNSNRELIAVAMRDKDQKKIKYCCVFPA